MKLGDLVYISNTRWNKRGSGFPNYYIGHIARIEGEPYEYKNLKIREYSRNSIHDLVDSFVDIQLDSDSIVQVIDEEPIHSPFERKPFFHATTGRMSYHDPINHPSHYTSHPSGIECIQITEHMDFLLGNAMKYLWRAGSKDQVPEVEDLEKAIWYINREIALLKGRHEKA